MKITLLSFDGSPDEFASVEHIFSNDTRGSSDSLSLPQGLKGESSSSLQASSIEKSDAVRKMLSRRSVKEGQRALYTALSDGEFMGYEELLRTLDRTRAQMAGLFGALGRRINKTPEIHQANLPGKCTAVLEWEERNDDSYIRLLPHTIEALKAEKII